MDHHGRAVAMAEINDLNWHALFAQRHRHRRENERGRRVTGEISLFQFRPAVESDRLEKAVASHLLVNEICDRTSEMTRHRQKSDPEFLVISRDRKSTLLNSSHPSISYAVFC